MPWTERILGKPCAGNLHARFEEGGGGRVNRPLRYSTGSKLSCRLVSLINRFRSVMPIIRLDLRIGAILTIGERANLAEGVEMGEVAL